MQYAWLIWSLILLGIWLVVYFSLRRTESRREMFWVSLGTSVFGLTEPFFVPEYWMPPSLFGLAARTGFDIESLIFSFGIGGIAAVIYERVFRGEHRMMSMSERHSVRHRLHLWTIASAPIIFILLWIFIGINPIYAVIVALTGGGLLTWYCRPDLKKKMLFSALIFLILYFAYFLILIAAYPGYVEKVWNLAEISGVLIFGVPLEELMFAASFGFLWSGVYEHLKWYKIKTI